MFRFATRVRTIQTRDRRVQGVETSEGERIEAAAGYQGTLSYLPEIYARITSPTMLLWAERDRHFPPAHAEWLHRLIPGSYYEIVPGAGHWMAWSRAGEVAGRILAFDATTH